MSSMPIACHEDADINKEGSTRLEPVLSLYTVPPYRLPEERSMQHSGHPSQRGTMNILHWIFRRFSSLLKPNSQNGLIKSLPENNDEEEPQDREECRPPPPEMIELKEGKNRLLAPSNTVYILYLIYRFLCLLTKSTTTTIVWYLIYKSKIIVTFLQLF